jgi:antitoxin component of MazEF toxin-antitoxin module
MGYLSKVQVIERAKGQRQFYMICPAPLAQALEIEKGETIEWVVEDKWTLKIRRGEAKAAFPSLAEQKEGVLHGASR